MLAILGAVCASLQLPGNGTLLAGPTSPIEVTWSSLTRGIVHTFTWRKGYISLLQIYTEEPTWLEEDGSRSRMEGSYYSVRLVEYPEQKDIIVGANAKVARLDLPIPMPCHFVAVLGRSSPGETKSIRVKTDGNYYEDIVVCALPVTSSKDEKSTVTVKMEGEKRLAAWTDSFGNAKSTCTKSKCEFTDLPTGDVITAVTPVGSKSEFKKSGPVHYGTDEPCLTGGLLFSLLESESSIGTTGNNTPVLSTECKWFPWTEILVIVLAILAAVGSIVGGIMCCYCGVCTCCGACTCWVKKEDGEMVDA